MKLRRARVGSLVVGGLATDYCVKNTVLDAMKAGFTTLVMTDCVKGVNAREGDAEAALELMATEGARLVTSSDVAKGVGA